MNNNEALQHAAQQHESEKQLLAEFDALELHQQMILALLALLGEPTGKTSIAAHLKKARVPGPHLRLARSAARCSNWSARR